MTTQQNDGPTNGYTGFNPLGMTSIWSNPTTQNQQPVHEMVGQQTSTTDELNSNQFQAQGGNRALNLQAQSTSVTTVASTPVATATSMNTTNSWSNTLFRNKQ